ncbi:MAG TPA: alpha/beta fold hydrolase [Candidatus Baltobacteraceae bacterium]
MDDEFARALERLERFQQRDGDRIGAAGRTLALVHPSRTPRAALLFHGLTASPMQFGNVARALFERGYNVLVPRLPRHGYADRMSTALASLTVDELKDAAEQSLEIVRGLGRRVTVSGFSVGGLLTSWIAQREDVDRAVPLMPFLGVIGVPDWLAAKLAALALRLPNAFLWWDPIARERQMPAHGYPRYPTHAVARAYLLARELLEACATQAPLAREIVVVNNRHETTVSNRAIALLVRRWRERRRDIETFAFDDLPFSHDVIEPLRHAWILEKVYPRLLRILAP